LALLSFFEVEVADGATAEEDEVEVDSRTLLDSAVLVTSTDEEAVGSIVEDVVGVAVLVGSAVEESVIEEASTELDTAELLASAEVVVSLALEMVVL
jgi:nitrogen regulatory protein PII-like uncharacterized protein